MKGKGVFGQPLKASEGSHCTKVPGLLCGATTLQIHQSWIGTSLWEYRREEWVFLLPLLWVSFGIGVDEITVSPEMLP